MRFSVIFALAAVGAATFPALGVAQETPTQPAAVAPAAPGAPASRGHHGFMAALRGVNLSDQQKAQIKQLVTQYRQAHPKGSAPDRAGRQQLRTEILNVLTPQQRAQFDANIARMRAERRNQPAPQGPFAPTPTPF